MITADLAEDSILGEPDERYRWTVNVAWRRLVGGVLAIAVGLAVWPTTFILVPTGAILVVIGMTKWLRSVLRSH